MIIFPAIDIKNGVCVRLRRGDFGTAEKVAEDPLETAHSFFQAGAQWIHMVDLDGAVQGRRVNSDIFTLVAAQSGLQVEIGGGIRTLKEMDYYLAHGIARVILGSSALKDAALVREAVREFGDAVAVGIDAKNGFVAAEGWLETSDIHYIDLAKRMEEAGVRTLIFTDIARDGMLNGPNLEQLAVLNETVSCNITASGGVTNLKDIKDLKQRDLYGAICGKSLYQGTLSLNEAIIAAGEEV